MGKIDLIALDLDGTFLDPAGSLAEMLVTIPFTILPA